MATKSKATVNPFDSIATVGKTSSKKSTKAQCPTTPELRKDVDDLIKINAEIAKLTAQQADIQTRLISAARVQQDADGFAGNFTKSYELAGDTGTITFTATDRWSEIKAEVLEAVKTFMGKLFSVLIQKRRTIALVGEASEDPKLLQALAETVTKNGYNVADAFEVTDQYFPVKDMDQKVYQYFKPAQLPEFRSLVSQYKPSVR